MNLGEFLSDSATVRSVLRSHTVTFAFTVIFAFTLSGCFGGGNGPIAEPGETQTESISVPLSGAKSVSAHLQMAAGELSISGGSPQLVEGKISYNVPDWKPDVSYSVHGTQGTLMLMQPESHHTTIGGVKYTWDLRFTNAVPLDLKVEMGAGNSTLNFGGMKLRNLHVETGAGNATLDFSGPWKQNVTATIEGGVGVAHLKLPRDVGVRVAVDGALGTVNAPDFKRDGDDYVNDSLGKSPVTLDIKIDGGIGQVYLELVGPRSVV